MRVYYYTSEKYAIEAILNSKLKICTFNTANDIFENDTFFSDINNRIIDDLKTLHSVTFNDGVICFTKRWDNGTMWGHYGDNHKGICLGFDIDHSYLHKILYTKSKICIDNMPNFDDKGNAYIGGRNVSFELLTSTHGYKHSDWSYEDEYRLICPLYTGNWDPVKNIYFLPFEGTSTYKPNLILKEIILGLRAEEKYDYFEKLLIYKELKESVLIGKVRKDQRLLNFVRTSVFRLYGKTPISIKQYRNKILQTITYSPNSEIEISSQTYDKNLLEQFKNETNNNVDFPELSNCWKDYVDWLESKI